MDKKQFRELLDAFYGSIERFVCEYDSGALRYSFFGKRAASFVRLAGYVARLAGGKEFVLEFGRAISSRWNVAERVAFEITASLPDLRYGKADRVDVTVTQDGGEAVFNFRKYRWAVAGRRQEKEMSGRAAIALTLNEAKMKRYRA